MGASKALVIYIYIYRLIRRRVHLYLYSGIEYN